MPDIRLLADDLTGALDSAAAFTGSIPVHLDRTPEGASAGAPGIVVVATPTRDIPPEALPAKLDALLGWFLRGEVAYKKIDSLLRGNTFAECAHIARAGGLDGIVFVPAFPAQRRLTSGGQHLLAASVEAGLDGATPIGAPVLAAFAEHGLSGSTSAASQPPVVAPPAGGAAAPQVWVPDVQGDADLRAIARLALPGPQALPGRWLWCASAGLAHAMAAEMATEKAPHTASAGACTAEPAVSAGPAHGRVLLLGASHQAVVRRQWALLREAQPQALTVIEGDEAQFAAACQALAGPGTVAALAALELSPTAWLTAEDAAALLQRQITQLVSHAMRPDHLLVVGGDTLLALCRATGVQSLRTLPARRPGWGHARFVGGRWDGADCHSRSGAFGDERDLRDMVEAVQG